MSKFKVGDLVKFKNEACVGIAPARDRYPEPFRVTGFDGEGTPLFEDAYWWDGRSWGYREAHFELVEEGTMNTKDLYTHKYDGTIVCGDTAIKAAKRKRDGEQQYIIAYEHSQVMNGAVKHSDIPALIAALLDVYDGDIKDVEEEIPF